MYNIIMEKLKRLTGRYYTEGNPFSLAPFHQWAERVNLYDQEILEPFAGGNNIIRSLQRNGYARTFKSYDLEPSDEAVEQRDTISDFPTGFNSIVTNPPWFAKNSATRRGIPFPEIKHDNLYKHCIDLCLDNAENVAMLVPGSFLQSERFIFRLDTFILLHDKGIFNDTESPVGLALFNHQPAPIKIFYDNDYIGEWHELSRHLPQTDNQDKIKFNAPDGKLGLYALDSNNTPSIQFFPVDEEKYIDVKNTSRMITKIKVPCYDDDVPYLASDLNIAMTKFRLKTKDVFLTPSMGVRKDGMYRRRLSYELAKRFIRKCLEGYQPHQQRPHQQNQKDHSRMLFPHR